MNGTVFYMNMFASIYILVVISVDRCVCVVWPVWAQNHRSVRKASWVSLGVWFLAFVFSSPYLFFRTTQRYLFYHNDITYCFDDFGLTDDYITHAQLLKFRFGAIVIAQFVMGIVIPFTVIVSCYSVIIYRLRRNRSLASPPFKIIAAVITTVFLCCAPIHIMNLIWLVKFLMEYDSATLSNVIKFGFPMALCLAFLKSCLNPLLYVFMRQDFKDDVLDRALRPTLLQT